MAYLNGQRNPINKESGQKVISDMSEKITLEGLTYDDVLLLPDRSEIMPRDVETTTFLTREIQLNIPLVSAAMDTVTESNLAIAIARQGGVGVLHKNMSIEHQANEVNRVKRSESGMILDPFLLVLLQIEIYDSDPALIWPFRR